MSLRLLPHYFLSHTGSTKVPRQLVATATSTANMARSHIGHVHIKLGCTVVATSDIHTNLMSGRVCWLVPTKTLPPTLGAQGCHASSWPLPHPLQAQPLPHRALRASIWLMHWAQSVDGLLLVFCGVQCIIALHKLRTASVLSWGTLKLSPVAVCNTKAFLYNLQGYHLS